MDDHGGCGVLPQRHPLLSQNGSLSGPTFGVAPLQMMYPSSMDGAREDADLTITTLDDSEIVTVVVSGEIDIFNASQLGAAGLSALQADPRALVIDMTAVTFMDSTGLGSLAGILRAARPTPVQLLISHPRVKQLFEITGLTAAFNVQHLT